MTRPAINIKGQRFESEKGFGCEAMEMLDSRDSAKSMEWRCRCDCGREFKTSATRLRNGTVSHCGCKGRMRKEREYIPNKVVESVQDFICCYKMNGENNDHG